MEVVEFLSFHRAVENPPHPTVVHTQAGGEQKRKLDVLLIQAAFHVPKGSSFFSDTGRHVGEKRRSFARGTGAGVCPSVVSEHAL